MAATLFCKRLLVSRPTLFRYLCQACADGQALPSSNQDNLQFQSLLLTKSATSELDETRDGNGGSSSLPERGHFELFSCKAGSPIQRFIMLGADPAKPFSLNFHLKRILLDEGKLCIVRPLLAGLLVSGFIPDLTTFNILIETYCKDLQYQHAVDVISTQMTAMGVEANESFYGDLGKFLCARLGPKSAFQLLQKLRANHIEVPMPFYHALITYLSEREILNNLGVVVFVMEHQQDESFASFIEEFCSSFDREELPEAISTLRSRMSADRVKMRIARLNSS